MTTYTATTTAQVQAYVTVARGGDTILLAPGTYDGLRLQNISKTSLVTITSLDASNTAVLTNFNADKVNGLKFSNLQFYTTNNSAMNLSNSHVVSFDNIDVHGTLNGSSHDDFRGLLIRNSSYVTVTNSHFHELTDGINPLGSSSITISGNTFDTIRDNGIAGGGNSQITISNNAFTSFDHEGPIHPDAIQFWTTGTTKSASDITITGNVIDRGAGAVVQGIFLRDEVGNLPYSNVNISNNVVLGEMYNGISLGGATNAVIRGNVVLGATDQQSWIGLFNVASAQVDDNIATAYNFSNSKVTGHGDVQATNLSLQEDGTYLSPLSAGTMLSPKLSGMSARAITDVMSSTDLLGFTDGPSRYGLTYAFATMEVAGTSGNDRLTVGAIGAYHLLGYDGNDTLIGGGNGTASVLEGGSGSDAYTIYQAIDRIVEAPGGGNDSVYTYVSYTLPAEVETIRAMAASLTLTGNAGDNSLMAFASGSVLYGLDGNDLLQGGAGVDRLYGGNGDDRLTAGDGNDYLDGGSGDDKLYGGNGNDTLVGGTGTNYYEGGAGADIMTGGAGVDTYGYRTTDFVGGATANRDTITNFSVANGDKIALIGVDANSATATMDRFNFIGNQGFHGVAGELRYAADGDGITVYGDTNGDKVADLAIHLTGLTSITQSSFVI